MPCSRGDATLLCTAGCSRACALVGALERKTQTHSLRRDRLGVRPSFKPSFKGRFPSPRAKPLRCYKSQLTQWRDPPPVLSQAEFVERGQARGLRGAAEAAATELQVR
jgi:hypothetical protein